MSAPSFAPLIVAAYVALGFLIGALHAGLLHRAVAALVTRPGPVYVVALQAGRLGFVVLAFWFVAQAGAAPLIAAAIGFTLAQLGARLIVGRA